VFRYNILYVTDSEHNSGGVLYSTALTQLFTGVYIIKLCVTGLFFLVRDDHNRATYIGQTVIMIIATVITVSFQVLLNKAFVPLLQFLPTSTGTAEPKKKIKKREHKCCIPRAGGYFQTLLQKCRDWNIVPTADQGFPISSETDELISPTYQHEALFVQKPTVWIPKDCLGINKDEILYVKKYNNSIRVSNKDAALDIKGKVTIT